MALSEVVLQEVQALVEYGFHNRHSLFVEVFEGMADELGLPEDVTEIGQMDAATVAELRAAIEEAFSRQADAQRSWAGPTDCDRLRQAFDVLDAQGIVSLEGCGDSQDEGVARVAHVAIVRNELGTLQNDAYCFFHRQDVMRAVEEGGLKLTYGTFKEGASEPVVASPPVPCPVCNGRGWIQPDPTGFPSACPTHVATVAARPAPSLAERVGHAVVKACRDAGLEVEWDGDTNKRISLPDFEWNRRPRPAQETDIREFLESWELEIRAGYTPAAELLEVLEARASDWFGEFTDFGPVLLDRLRSHTEQLIKQERAREALWKDATMNDRIGEAFSSLDARGIVALECRGSTNKDGWGYVGLNVSAESRGAAFFHQGDVVDAVHGGGLLVAFGALGVDASADDEATVKIGEEILSVLAAHGVPASWSRSVRERIKIAPFEWRKRRWTEAPAFERQATTARPSLFGRLFGASTRQPGVAVISPPARESAEVVTAFVDERRFDLRRTHRLREVWKKLGKAGEAQVGHLGVPHVFVRPGELTTMWAVCAAENLREEKNEILSRAARAEA